MRNLELVGTEPNSMLAIQYGLSVGGARDYTIDNVTIENFELGVHGRSLNMTITNAISAMLIQVSISWVAVTYHRLEYCS